MPRLVNGCVPLLRAFAALTLANARYWLTVAPQVRRELRWWERSARAIGDPLLRRMALEKLSDAGPHAQITATLATIAPHRRRADVVTAIVALEVMYDFLDAVTEQPVPDALSSCMQLNCALGAPFTLRSPEIDYYRHCPQHDDGGYLNALVAVCGAALRTLPAFSIVAPVASGVASRCGEAQARSHAVTERGPLQLAAWASLLTTSGLTWWEAAAGAAASVLTLHALIALAADPRTTERDARRIDAAYLPICALVTLLDSLVDLDRDATTGSHRYVSYYGGPTHAAERIAAVARQATAAAGELRHGSHHVMAVAGAAAYYLSAPEAHVGPARPVARCVARQLQPLIAPILGIFRLWRFANRVRRATAPPRLRCRLGARDDAVLAPSTGSAASDRPASQ